MPCKSCNDRWRIIIANQEKNNIMKKDSKEKDLEVFESNIYAEEKKVLESRPNINKIIENRRKALENGKIIKK